jgi:hypothetical protein
MGPSSSRRPLVALTAGVAALLAAAPRASRADDPPAMRYVFDAPESARDVRYVYHWKILEAALERTRAKYGPYVLTPSVVMSERRQVDELEKGSDKLTVMYLSTLPELERDLVPVRIPVDRNLGGYCVFLIRADDQRRFDAVETRADLDRFQFGLGLGWIDVDILRRSGLRVVPGSSYDGLFEMLVNRRFDIFLRSAVEVVDEYEQRRAEMPELHIEDRLLFYYPLPMYFWFAKTDRGRRLAARAEEGMRAMIADGTYARIFSEHQDEKIRRLRLKDRKVIRIENPFLGPETPFADAALWFDPQTYELAPPRTP